MSEKLVISTQLNLATGETVTGYYLTEEGRKRLERATTSDFVFEELQRLRGMIREVAEAVRASLVASFKARLLGNLSRGEPYRFYKLTGQVSPDVLLYPYAIAALQELIQEGRVSCTKNGWVRLKP